MENVFENFTVSVLKLNKLVQKIKLYEMQSYGLKAIHVMCVYYLNLTDGLTSGELVKLTLEDKAAISRAIQTLKEKGYAEYDSSKHNSRIRLTDEGKKLAGYISERSENAVNAGSAELTEEERALFYRSLGSIAENLTAYYESLIKNDRDNTNKADK